MWLQFYLVCFWQQINVNSGKENAVPPMIIVQIFSSKNSYGLYITHFLFFAHPALVFCGHKD